MSSPPAIWMPDGPIVTPGIRDAERLQGFAPDWTAAVAEVARPALRWKLVGHAVSVPVAEWIGRRLIRPGAVAMEAGAELGPGCRWPDAAAAVDGVRRTYHASHFPVSVGAVSLRGFLQFPTPPLSARAAASLLARGPGRGFECPPEFRVALREHVEAQAEEFTASSGTLSVSGEL